MQDSKRASASILYDLVVQSLISMQVESASIFSSYPNLAARKFDYESLKWESYYFTENFLKKRSYGLEDTQVGTVFYCTGVFNSYHHESSGITDTRVRDWARALKEYTGKDSLTTMVDYVHSIDKDIFWSVQNF